METIKPFDNETAPDTDEHGRVKVTLEDRSIEYVSREDLEAASDFFDSIG